MAKTATRCEDGRRRTWWVEASTAGGLAIVAALAAMLFFFHLGTYGLWEPDEGRYAEIAREMLASRNFIVPHLNYVPYIEKPPLLYWLTVASMRSLGANELAARLPDALAALLGVLATYIFALRTFDRRRAILAGAILATSGLYATMAQVLTTDMLLAALMAVAMFAFFLQWLEDGRWWWLSYAAMGLAVLAKGPVGAAIPITVAVIFLWYEADWRCTPERLHPAAGLLLTAAISLPWFVLIAVREPGFLDFYIVGEHFRRFFEPSYSHAERIYFYVPVAAAGLLPWTLALPFVPWRSLAPNAARRFCFVAIATVFVLFSLASAKLAAYILPLFPLAAVVIADGLMTFGDEPPTRSTGRRADARVLAAFAALLSITGATLIVIAWNAGRFASPNPMLVRPALFSAGAIIVVCAVLCYAAFWTRRLTAGLCILVAGAAATLIVGSYGRIMAEPARSYATLARQIEQRAPNARLICYPRYIQSLPFYCRRRVILVGAKTELAYGAAHSADAASFFFASERDLLRLWKQPQPTVLIIDRRALAHLEKSLGPYEVIASDAKKLALTRPEPSWNGG